MVRTERRRASEEYGKARRKPSRPARPETPVQRSVRRTRSIWRGGTRLYRRHRRKRGASLFLLGTAGLIGSIWAFQGAVQLITIGVCGAGMVGGYVLDRRDHAKAMQSSRRPSFAEQRRYATNRAAGRAFDDDRPDASRVRVRSHRRDGDGVTAHTRARPGQGSGPCHCCGAEKAPKSVTIAGRRFPACVRCAAESGW